MRRFVLLALVAVLNALSTAQVQGSPAPAPCRGTTIAGPLRVAPKPADATAQSKLLIGEYEDHGTVLTVFERCGELYLLSGKSRHRLVERSSTQFTVIPPTEHGTTVVFEHDGSNRVSSLAVGKQSFRHAFGEDTGKSFRIAPLRSPEEVRKDALAAEPPRESGKRKPDLVELTTLEPSIKLDIRYATSNNFMGTPFYTEARAFLQRPAAQALVRANRRLKAYGYGLLIHDAYRPWYVTKMFWDATPDDKKGFVADPAKGSNHNRGAAVDLSLYELSTGKPVRMPGGYDEMSERSHPDYPGGTSLERWHRDLLRTAMESEGFRVDRLEWWHFNFRDYKSYPVLNIPVDRISSSSKTESNRRETEKH